MMNNEKTDTPRAGGNPMFALLQLLMIVVGGIFVKQGVEALQNNTIITATTKHGPLTGAQAIVIGVGCILWGLVSIGLRTRRSNKTL